MGLAFALSVADSLVSSLNFKPGGHLREPSVANAAIQPRGGGGQPL